MSYQNGFLEKDYTDFERNFKSFVDFGLNKAWAFLGNQLDINEIETMMISKASEMGLKGIYCSKEYKQLNYTNRVIKGASYDHHGEIAHVSVANVSEVIKDAIKKIKLIGASVSYKKIRGFSIEECKSELKEKIKSSSNIEFIIINDIPHLNESQESEIEAIRMYWNLAREIAKECKVTVLLTVDIQTLITEKIGTSFLLSEKEGEDRYQGDLFKVGSY